MVMTREEARADIEGYLGSQSEEYFAERGQSREEVLNNEEIMDSLVNEHMACVNRYGVERDWSVKDACDVEPGFYAD